MNPKLWWYLARATGLVAWGAAGVAIVVGLTLSGRLSRRPTPAWQLDLHRFLGGISVLFLAVHLIALSLDPTIAFGPAALAIPMASPWRPGAVAWGIVAADALIAVEVSSLFMTRIPKRVWRAIHFASYGVWITGTVHALQAGSDSAIVRIVALGGSIVIVNLTVVRIVGRRIPRARSRVPAGAAIRTPVPHPSVGE
ncbi:MAG: ferric reductase-like transmembrane domain-containing protein [Acidimicrobiia bacterium]|nr:ferric reductase-like transmembrane domain-containing protein [Acidimicrobiia bacterium]